MTKRSRCFIFSSVGIIILALIFIGLRPDSLQFLLAKTFPSDKVLLAKVVSVHEERQDINGEPSFWDTIVIEFLTGSVRGEKTDIHNRLSATADPKQKIKVGETIIVAESTDFQGDRYYMADRYRLPTLVFLGLIFVLAIVVIGGIRGLTSLLGLAASLAVLLLFIIPRILSGNDPLVISFIGAVVIAVVSLYLAHGFSKRTTVALAGTLITLVIAIILTVIFTSATNLLGIATEESFLLKLNVGNISLRGLLLAGIIIGMLGVLDDVTIGQAATVQEIKEANPTLGLQELYRRGITVGKEHIASLVNTLVLAYAGTALPLLLLLVVQGDNVPFWLAINGEPIAEEIVRTLVGSLALVFAVPITTLIAAYYYGKARHS
ncbi:MAG: YibE/F family protein [Patescibacteria group bacterium]